MDQEEDILNSMHLRNNFMMEVTPKCGMLAPGMHL
jgi:hypothetical protein